MSGPPPPPRNRRKRPHPHIKIKDEKTISRPILYFEENEQSILKLPSTKENVNKMNSDQDDSVESRYIFHDQIKQLNEVDVDELKPLNEIDIDQKPASVGSGYNVRMNF
jgi:hypothetical protein